MTPFDRQVRAQIYKLMVGGAASVDAEVLAASRGWEVAEVASALRRLETEHRIALVGDTTQVWMAHPFSGVETSYQAVVGEQSWFANCACGERSARRSSCRTPREETGRKARTAARRR